ncbi:MAG: T9SS type A sorting domain-containing protein [Candidatus Marinimicrobia bacterium]|nr:T9SS type A sorting domain-containing protein [Candidatus Neomarinimicrobiota bacterium]
MKRLVVVLLAMVAGLFAYSGGDGSSGDPYQIASLADLLELSTTSGDWVATTYFIQKADFDASATSGWNVGDHDGDVGTADEAMGFSPIGNADTPFAGTYDGQNHTISGLTINRNAQGLGLFGEVDAATISNLGMVSVNITNHTTYRYAGGLVGHVISGTVNNCYSTGWVKAAAYGVGGLAGKLSSGTISNCYSTVDVETTGYVGGLVGFCATPGIISNCYSTGAVVSTALSSYGGLVGKFTGASVTNSFWDIDSSGQASSAVGTGKTTAEMKDYTTFTAAGWDFVSETTNGTDNYWDADQTTLVNSGYPILSWQTGADNSLPVELSLFTATRKDNSMLLNWITESEIENLGFILERSENSGPWQEIASYKDNPNLAGQGSVSYRTEYSYTDANIINGIEYNYRLADVSYEGEVKYHTLSSKVEDANHTLLPAEMRVHQNYPNPFNPSTMISWELGASNRVELSVYDVSGRLIRELVNSRQTAGYHETLWDGSDAEGQLVPAGLYFYRVSSAQQTQTQKMLLLK